MSLRLFGLLVIACANSNLLFAAEYYVSVLGSDGNSGDRSRPWATIQHAAQTVTTPLRRNYNDRGAYPSEVLMREYSANNADAYRTL